MDTTATHSQAKLNAVVEALIGVISWAENHETWWVDCPDKGGLDIEKLQRIVDDARSQAGIGLSAGD